MPKLQVLTILMILTLAAGYSKMLAAATDPALVDLLVAKGVLTEDQASQLEVAEGAETDPVLIEMLLSKGVLSEREAAKLQEKAPKVARSTESAPESPDQEDEEGQNEDSDSQVVEPRGTEEFVTKAGPLEI